MNRSILVLLVMVLFSTEFELRAQDVQWRGPNRDGIYPDAMLLKDTGEIKWIADFHTKGPILYADGMLYCQEEKRGHMALVKADPEAFEVISSFRVSEGAGPHWARPTIFNKMLLVRHGDVLLAYKIKPS